MAFVFEALPARYGDCLLLTFGEGAEAFRLLIDGGPGRVYAKSLKPRLDKERPAPGQPVTLDMVMVSHIDEDHILGVLDLFTDMRDADERKTARPWRVKALLHNSLDSLLAEGEGGAARAFAGQTPLAAVGGVEGLGELLGKEPDALAERVLASYPQGSRLASVAAALSVPRNPPDQGLIWFAPPTPRVIPVGRTASLTIVGPLEPEVAKLRKEWAVAKIKRDGAAALAAYIDKSAPNLSSIVGLLEADGVRVLLTGDARGDKILKGLEDAGLLGAAPLEIDVLKLPHHGSVNNVEEPFFERVHARHYVVSGDGTYGNPDRATLDMLEKARPEGGFTVHLTYAAADCDATHRKWREDRRKPVVEDGVDTIADLVDRWRAEGRIAVEEGPVRLALGA